MNFEFVYYRKSFLSGSTQCIMYSHCSDTIVVMVVIIIHLVEYNKLCNFADVSV